MKKAMKDKEHTPTPWRLGGISGRMVESKGNTGFIADVDLKANAELIIKAVNNHNRLVEELTHVVKALETVSSFGATTPIIDHAKQLLAELKTQ